MASTIKRPCLKMTILLILPLGNEFDRYPATLSNLKSGNHAQKGISGASMLFIVHRSFMCSQHYIVVLNSQ